VYMLMFSSEQQWELSTHERRSTLVYRTDSPSRSAVFSLTFNILYCQGPYRRTRRGGLGGLPESGKRITFRAIAKFFGQKPTAKNWKIFFF